MPASSAQLSSSLIYLLALQFALLLLLLLLLPAGDALPAAKVAGRRVEVSPTSQAASPNSQILQISPVSAMDRLLRVFGLEHHKTGRKERHATPPQYMLDLYNTIADKHSGVTRHDNPYHADVVKSYPDADVTQHHLHFHFNVLDLDVQEKLLEAEFHVYKLKPRSLPKTKVDRSGDSRSHLLEMRVYQVLNESLTHREEGNRLLDARRISAYSTGWEVFHVHEAVTSWLANHSSNYGLLVSLRTLSGDVADDSKLRVVKRRHHNGRQPILVLFTSDGRKKPDQLRDEELELHWNGLHTEQDETFDLSADASDTSAATSVHSGRSLRLGRSAEAVSTASPSAASPSPTSTSDECSRHELDVDFEAIGWSGWIISPKSYNAHYCSGNCSFPLGQNQRPTNHATVQSIVHELGLQSGIHSPCCVPNKLLSINLLYYDDHGNVVFKRYDDMVAASCGCH